MGKLFIFMGKSASGKDTLYQKVRERNPALKSVIPYTTRPIRTGETEGKEYHFVTVEQLKELENLLEEVKVEAEAIRDEIKQEMMARDTEELEAGQYIVRWTSILSNRFDTTAFKKVMPDVYKAYTKQISSRRFTIV